MDALGHFLQQGSCEFLVRGEFLQVDWDEDLLCLCIDVADIHTTLVGEENPVTLQNISTFYTAGFWGSLRLGRS